MPFISDNQSFTWPLTRDSSPDMSDDDGASSVYTFVTVSDDDDASVCEEEQLSIRQSAHNEGLCRDFRTENPLASDLISHCLASDTASHWDSPDCFDDLLKLNGESWKDGSFQEKWDIDKGTATMLASIMALSKDEDTFGDVSDMTTRFSDLKMCDTLLLTDPENELRQIRQRNAVALSGRGLSPFDKKEIPNKGLKWGNDYLLAIQEAKNTDTRLEVDKSTLQYLQSVVKPPEFESDMISILLSDDEKENLLKPLSPPLLPLSSPISLQDLPPPVKEMDFTSSPEDLLAKEAEIADQDLMKADNTSAPSNTPRAVVGSNANTEASASAIGFSSCTVGELSSPLQRKRIQELKIHSPLTPQDVEESPAKKSKHDVFPSTHLQDFAAFDEFNIGSTIEDEDLEWAIQQCVAPFAEPVIAESKQERLIEADTVFRVVPPVIPAVLPVPPWLENTGSLDTKQSLIRSLKAELPLHQCSWNGVANIERVLSWKAFPSRLAKIDFHEELEGDTMELVLDLRTDMDLDLDLEYLVGHSSNLSLLDNHDSDDEEIYQQESWATQNFELDHGHTIDSLKTNQPLDVSQEWAIKDSSTLTSAATAKQVFQPQNTSKDELIDPMPGKMTMESLLQKRLVELSRPAAVPMQDNRLTSHAANKISQPPQLLTEHDGDLNISSGLASFMRLHNVIKPTLVAQSDVSRTHPVAPPANMLAPITAQRSADEVEPQQDHSYPKPKLPPSRMTADVVLTTEMLNNRPLIKHLQQLIANLNLVERIPVKRKDQGPRIKDADMTISPSTGLIVTTLQQLKQRPLPGQTDFFGIRDHISAVILSHERIFVFVSENRQDVSRLSSTMDQRDCDALNDLTGFADRLPADVDIKYVPGGNGELAAWIAATISRYAIPELENSLLVEETLWERFLRTAGFNSFAAQIILKALQAPAQQTNDTETAQTGLGAFIAMSKDQRVEQFGHVLGGDRVLRRVSDIIDTGWMSVAAMRH